MLTETIPSQVESKADYWRQHIENCNNSSLSQAKYCQKHSLALATFCHWKKKLNMTRQHKARFYPLTVPPAAKPENKQSRPAGLSLYLGNEKFRVEFTEDFSVLALKKLITALDQS